MLKSLWVHPHLSLNLHAKYKEPPLYGSFGYFVHRLVSLQNACVRKRGITQTKTLRIGSKVDKKNRFKS